MFCFLHHDEHRTLLGKRNENIDIVNNRIHKLFQSQLQSLREYYGRRYESVLSDLEEKININADDIDENDMAERREKMNAALTDAAKRSSKFSFFCIDFDLSNYAFVKAHVYLLLIFFTAEGFRVAAINAIPQILKEGSLKELGRNYSFDSELDGLIRDMMHATSSCQMLEEEWKTLNDSGNDEASTGIKRRRGPIKWYEKLAARILVISVNYVQGWLALQGIRKAASDRDKMMPKFPMF